MGDKEVRRICSSLSLALAQWRMAVVQGKILLDSVTSILYPEEEEEKVEKLEEWQPKVQASCLALQDQLDRMAEVVVTMEAACEKAVGLEQLLSLSLTSSSQLSESLHPLVTTPRRKAQDLLLNSSAPPRLSSSSSFSTTAVPSSSLASWASTLLSCHSSQLDLARVVARTFCHLSSRGEAKYLTAVWTVQPALDTEAAVAEVAVEELLKTCPPT